MDITLELSADKWPPAETLGTLFEANLDAMLALPMAVMFGGVRWGSIAGTWTDERIIWVEFVADHFWGYGEGVDSGNVKL